MPFGNHSRTSGPCIDGASTRDAPHMWASGTRGRLKMYDELSNVRDSVQQQLRKNNNSESTVGEATIVLFTVEKLITPSGTSEIRHRACSDTSTEPHSFLPASNPTSGFFRMRHPMPSAGSSGEGKFMQNKDPSLNGLYFPAYGNTNMYHGPCS